MGLNFLLKLPFFSFTVINEKYKYLLHLFLEKVLEVLNMDLDKKELELIGNVSEEVIVERKLSVRNSIVNMIPTILGVALYSAIGIMGTKALADRFSQSEFYEVMLMMFMLIMWGLVRIIPVAKTVYEVEESGQGDEDE